ncbi:hypothetical protein [Peribacillus alkalitolerans]|uniref:hypothetical protein n=1 Tax=Peribacillus alkalitolerans TaxID=1550385 RepID=UPI0013D15772|nr:hypothetical protein [Peribacillus alkalitolerans]
MSQSLYEEILNKLASKELNEYTVSKEEFLAFRSIIVQREDFKHFRGIAQQGGTVKYQYMDEARS